MKVFVDTIGCRLNQSEIEKIASHFRLAGHEITDNAAEADIAIINTCTVTSKAASDSRSKIRQAARAGSQKIIATGCWATLEPDKAAALSENIEVILNQDKDNLTSHILSVPKETFDQEPIARVPLPGIHQRTRAFIKVQDGCDNHCTFCITRIARGPGSSRPIKDVLRDIENAIMGNAKEVVLTGVHLASWGKDFSTPLNLQQLVEAILKNTDVPRIRLSSLESWDLGEAFYSLWDDNRLCRHLHLPLQSGSNTTLKRMARKTDPDTFAEYVKMIRKISPEIAITTDVIVGFPGETEQDFLDSLNFVKRIQFAGGHVFNYSARPGTPAAKYPDQIPNPIRKERSAAMRSAFSETEEIYYRKFIGTQAQVLWESVGSYGPKGWKMQGLTDNYLKVTAYSPEPIRNQISQVLLTSYSKSGLNGEIIAIRKKQ